MDILHLLFDPKTGCDSVIAGRHFELDDATANELSQAHFISRVQVAEKRSATDEGETSSIVTLREEEGQLVLAFGWGKPVALCQLLPEDDLDLIAAELQKRLLAVSHWLHDLHQVGLQSTDPSELLSVAYRYLGYPLVLFDGGFNLVGYAMDETQSSKAFEDTIEKGYASGVSEEHQREYRSLASHNPQGFETEFAEVGNEVTVWVHPFSTYHSLQFFLHTMFAKQNQRGLRSLVDDIVLELRAVLERMEVVQDHRLIHDFLAELITVEMTEEKAEQRADFFGWQAKKNSLVMRVESFSQSLPDMRLHEIEKRLFALMPQANITIVEHGLVLLLDDDKGGKLPVSESALEQLLLEEDVWMIVSDPVTHLNQVVQAYSDICAAMGVLRQNMPVEDKNISARLAYYDQCKYLLISSSLQKMAFEHDILPNSLRMIRQYDTRHDTEFELTMLTFIKNHLSKQATCTVLSIHRSTLQYRLDRLKELFGIDFEDERTIFHLTSIAQL